MKLHELLTRSVFDTPHAVAVRAPDGDWTYRELDAMANRAARALTELGVRRGDLVGIWAEKSARVIVLMQATLRLGAAYVPVDPQSPTTRAASILVAAGVRVLATTAERARAWREGKHARMAVLTVRGEGIDLDWSDVEQRDASALPCVDVRDDDVAYVLHTSGSTGRPKGVCISHANALAFIDWAAAFVEARPTDRFSSHASFHFDLSVLDLYVSFHAGACVCLVPDKGVQLPRALVEFVREQAITVWYSVPSALSLMIEHGGLLERELPSLRAVLFAGEVFALRHVRALRERWPTLRLCNLYGPTETNVCTCHEVTAAASSLTEALPIGTACCGDRVWVADEHGERVAAGEEGELWVSGPTLMRGYLGEAPWGDRPYPTGDRARQRGDGAFVFLGRRDDMLKVRGHRIAPAEVESVLREHASVAECAVAVLGTELHARLVAFVVPREGRAPSLIELKRHCARSLPRAVIIDAVRLVVALPRNSNGKLDRARLLAREAETAST